MKEIGPPPYLQPKRAPDGLLARAMVMSLFCLQFD
jgi:hypothetical protein